MKKILIAACAIAFSAVSQAAALNWTAYGALNDGGADEDWYSGGQAYLLLVTSDSINVGVVDGALKVVSGATVIDSALVDGGTGAGAFNTDTFVNGDTYKFAVLFTTDGTSENMPTSGLYGMDDNGGAFYSVTWNSATGGEFANDGSSWAAVTQSIPEPTSGLMLLLGVAGLALRRKQK